MCKNYFETRFAEKIKEDPKSFYAYVRTGLALTGGLGGLNPPTYVS